MIRMLYRISLILFVATSLLFWALALYRAFCSVKGSFSARLRQLFSQELSPLSFCPASLLDSIGQWLFSLGVVLYLLGQMVSNSVLPGLTFLRVAGREGVLILFLAKILLFTKVSPRQLFRAGLFSIPFLLCQSVSDNRLFLFVLLFVLAARDVNLRKSSALALPVMATFYGACIVLDQSQLIDPIGDGLRRVNGIPTAIRHAFGFAHPNTAGYFLAFIAVMWLLLRWHRLRWWDWCLAAAALYCIHSVIDSRGSMLSFLCVLSLLILFRIYPGFSNLPVIKQCIPLAPFVCAAASLFGAYFYDPSNPIWIRINNLSSDRLYLFNLSAQSYSITPFGQVLDNPDVYTLDNAYLKLFFQAGVPALFVFLLGLFFLLRRMIKIAAYAELSVVLGGCIYCLFETAGALPYANLSLWLLTSLAWGTPSSQQSLFTIPLPKHLS